MSDYDFDAEYDAKIAADKAAARIEMIAGIRAMADFLETHENVEMPYSLCGMIFAGSASELRSMTHLSGHWDKKYDDYSATYSKTFTPPPRYSANSVRLVINVERQEVCQKVEVGTRHVEAIPAIEAHDETVYEWVCTDAPDTEMSL